METLFGQPHEPRVIRGSLDSDSISEALLELAVVLDQQLGGELTLSYVDDVGHLLLLIVAGERASLTDTERL